MPSTTYRRKLRARETNATMQLHYIQQTSLPSAVSKQKGECEIEKIQNYFYNVLDMLTNQLNFTEATATLTNIIKTLSTRVEFFKLLDTIEHNLFSTVVNIMDGTTANIIATRIAYVKTFIERLPPICQEPGPVSDMIMEILESLIATMSSQSIAGTILQIQTRIREKYGHFEQMEEIQDNLLNIVDIMGSGAPINIITLRVNFVRDLLCALDAQIH
jgi:hypothetical protein